MWLIKWSFIFRRVHLILIVQKIQYISQWFTYEICFSLFCLLNNIQKTTEDFTATYNKSDFLLNLMCDCCDKVTLSYTFYSIFHPRAEPIQPSTIERCFLWDNILHICHYFDTKNSRHVHFVYHHHFNQCRHCKWCIIFCTWACFLAKAPVLRIQNQKCSPNSVVFVERKHGTKCRKHLRIFLRCNVVNSLMRFSF